MLSTIIIFLIILSVLVIFHELGHFLFARVFRVKVLEFGLGFPPRAKKLFTDRHGTLFSLNWLPFGGFVAMAGEDAPGEDVVAPAVVAADQAEAQAATQSSPPSTATRLISHSTSSSHPDRDFHTKPAWQRLVIICAGPFFSFLLGVICFTFLYTVKGIPRDYEMARIVEVAPDSPAAAAGLQPQTGIYELIGLGPDGVTLHKPTVTQVIDYAALHRGQTIELIMSGPCAANSDQCATQGTRQTVYIRTPEETPTGQGAIGIAFSEQYIIHRPWWQMPFYAAIEGTQQSLWLSAEILRALADLIVRLFAGQGVGQAVAGPVGIVSTVQKEGLFDQGVWLIVGFAGMLSVNLAVMNMLPIPAVDGGRALLIILEKFFSRARIARIEGALNTAGFLVLILLMVLVTFHDIFQIVRGG